MKPLDEQIIDIEALDELRRRAKALRQDAIEALTQTTYLPQPRLHRGDWVRQAWKNNCKRANWAPPGDDVEKAIMLQALSTEPRSDKNKEHWKASREALIADLTDITYKDCDPSNPALDTVPIFRCAQILQALARTPGFVLSRAALTCFYCVVRELNEIAGPSWSAGAARANNDAMPTAFIAGECTRAILALEQALRDTAKVARLLGDESARKVNFRSDFELWRDQEEQFRAMSLRVSLGTLRPHLIADLSEADLGAELADEILKKIEQTLLDMPEKLDDLPSDKFPDLPDDKKPEKARPEDRIQDVLTCHFGGAANVVASYVLKRLLCLLRAPVDAADSESLGKLVAEKLENGAQLVRDLLEPVESFAETIIDRELAAHSPPLGAGVDGAELVFAATLLGLLSDWKRPKVRAAWEVLQPLLSVNGRLRSIRPFHVQDKGYRLNAQTLEVTRRFAELIAHLDVEPEPHFVERLMLPFEYTRVPGLRASERGWTTDPPGRNAISLWWLTAIAEDALESIIRMLDATINRQVCQHFQVRQPSSLKLSLEQLFYPDFGFAAFRKLHGKLENNVAVKLQQLRAHAGIGPVEKDRLFSLILYGPPGTGKTTLVEAIAKSADAPLFEITPSDIMVGGTEGVERRTRHVFQALTKLTHAVILFDEFDSILLDRAKRDPDEIPRSVIEFLTPGMLPKLKSLNEASKEQRISFVLATNYVDRLDRAVTRGGRFDDRHGIYPPDIVSQLGRLLDQLKRNKLKSALEHKIGETEASMNEEADPARKAALARELGELREEQEKDIAARRFRILKAINDTKSCPMDTLGKLGWYTAPRESKDLDGALFGYVLNNTDKEDVAPEAKYHEERRKYEELRSRQARKEGKENPEPLTEPYWLDWEKINAWTEKFDGQLTARSPGDAISWTKNAVPEWVDVFEFIKQRLQEAAL
jgi:adenylate kinase family enzyme